jgi:uncharacterized protein (DUF2267 family)
MPGPDPDGEVQPKKQQWMGSQIVRYEEFVDRVAERAGLSRADTEKLATAVVRTLGERLSGGEAEDLRAQLPEPIKGYLISTREEAEGFGVEEFARRVAERVSPGEFDDVLAQLGREFAELVDSTS